MKLLLALFVSLAIIAGCGKGNKNNESEKKTDDKKTETTEQTKQPEGTNNTDPQNAGDNGSDLTGLTYDVKLPSGIKYDGKIVASAKWTDKNGDNYIIVTEGEEKNQNGDERMKEMFGYQFIVKGDDSKQLWKINDFIKDCPVDITLEYMPKSLSVTDLDKNGIAETTFLYRMSCKGDVSEDDMKLMMHEGETKLAIRGSMKLKMAGETYGGEMKVDKSFDSAPKEFLSYAKEQWNKYQTEKIGE